MLYQYYTNTSTCINRLTPEIVQFLDLSKTFQKITPEITHQSHTLNRRFHILTKKIVLQLIKLTSWGLYHAECAVPVYPESVYLSYYRKISLFANFPGFQIALSCDRHRSIHKTFHDYKYLLLRSSSVLYIITKTGVLDIPISIPFGFTRDSVKKISNDISRIVSYQTFPTIFLHR